MLKEIFVILDGVLTFHYATDPKLTNSDETILSSGLLTAIQNFGEGARSDALDSFTMANEFFIFKKISSSAKTLVGVFEKKTPQNLARDSLNRIFEELNDANLPNEDGFIELNSPAKQELKKRIGKLVSQLFGTKEDVEHVNELLSKRTDIPLAFIFNIYEKKPVTVFARPKPLFKEQQVTDFFLLNSSLNKAFSALNLKGSMTFMTIKSSEYTVSGIFCGKNASIASGSMNRPDSDVTEAALQMCHFYDLNELLGPLKDEIEISNSNFSANGNITDNKGEKISQNASIFLLTLINNINGFFRLITRRNFEIFTIYLTAEKIVKLCIERINSTEDFIIRICNFTRKMI